jgi:hypothetical protein
MLVAVCQIGNPERALDAIGSPTVIWPWILAPGAAPGQAGSRAAEMPLGRRVVTGAGHEIRFILASTVFVRWSPVPKSANVGISDR